MMRTIKKVIHTALLTTVFMICGCQDDSAQMELSEQVTIQAQILEPQTRTAMSELDGSRYHVLWSADEEIVIGQTSNFTTFGITEGNGTSLAQFTGEAPSNVYGSFYAAAYPTANASAGADDDYIFVGNTLSASQTYKAETFVQGMAPMASVSVDGNLYQFRNLYSILQLPIKGQGTLTQITLSGNNSEKVAGGIEMCYSKTDGTPVASSVEADNGCMLRSCTPDENSITLSFGADGLALSETDPVIVNIVLLPGTFSGGFTLRILNNENDGVFEKYSNEEITFRRSIVKRMKPFDYRTPELIETDPDVEPWNGEPEGELNEDVVYSFNFEDEKDALQMFSNTNEDSEVKSIPVASLRTNVTDPTIVIDWDWQIDSYKVGSAAPVTVEGTDFTGGGLDVSMSGSVSELYVQAKARTAIGGNNRYWQNLDSRTDNLDWSPESWASTTASSPIDLSRFNFRTETTNGVMNTANCYIIRHAGTYMLPLVYGNGVTNGVEYTDSYAPALSEITGEASSWALTYNGGNAPILTPFVNHLDKGITSAFIENNKSADDINYITAVTPYVVWQDKDKVVKNLEIVGDSRTDGSFDISNVRYLKFTISQEDICQNNALIAVKDADGKIIWSWHIWTTNDPGLISAPIPVTNRQNHVYKFFPIFNLGWLDAETYPARDDVTIVLKQKTTGNTLEVVVKQSTVATDSRCCSYQWGRKDPMYALNDRSASEAPSEGSFSYIDCTSSRQTYGFSIQNPGAFLKFTATPYALWCQNTYNNLWMGKSIAEKDQDQDDTHMLKTVYDPSPVGYKVPVSNAYSAFTTDWTNSGTNSGPLTPAEYQLFNVVGEFTGGWNFYTLPSESTAECIHTSPTPTIFFKSVGLRNYSTGYIGTNGAYWAANANPTNNGAAIRALSISQYKVHPRQGYARTYGMEVRPVIDTSMPGGSPME